MPTKTIETLTKMLENLPDSVQDQAIDHLREYLDEITDELRWDESFKRSDDRLSEIADSARQEVANGKTAPMDFDRL